MYEVSLYPPAMPHWPRGHNYRVYDLGPLQAERKVGDLGWDLGPTGIPYCFLGPLPSSCGVFDTAACSAGPPSLSSPKEGLLLKDAAEFAQAWCTVGAQENFIEACGTPARP